MKSLIKSCFSHFYNLLDGPAVILLYHRVTALTSDPQLLAVTPTNFNDHLSLLKSAYTLLEIEEFYHIRQNKIKMPKRSVVITFDDGYADNYYEALPLLESHNAQALFYVSTSLLDTNLEFWWDDLERIFLSEDKLPPCLDFNFRGVSFNFQTNNNQSRKDTYYKLHPIVKSCNVEERGVLLNQIIDWSGFMAEGRSTHRVLTTQELISLDNSKAAIIGAHTHTHPCLSNCTMEKQREEILISKKQLETCLKKTIDHFSYPFGSKSDFNSDSISVCKGLNFKMVCANFPSQVHSWHDTYALPRMIVRDWPIEEFKKKMNLFFTT